MFEAYHISVDKISNRGWRFLSATGTGKWRVATTVIARTSDDKRRYHSEEDTIRFMANELIGVNI